MGNALSERRVTNSRLAEFVIGRQQWNKANGDEMNQDELVLIRSLIGVLDCSLTEWSNRDKLLGKRHFAG